MSPVVCPAPIVTHPTSPTPYSILWGGGKETYSTKCMFWFSVGLSETFLALGRIRHCIIITVHRSRCNVPVILVNFQSKFDFPDRFFFTPEESSKSNFMEIRPVGAEFFHVDVQNKLTDMKKLMVGFRNFENEPKQPTFLLHSFLIQPIYRISVKSVHFTTLIISYYRPVVSSGEGLPKKERSWPISGIIPTFFRNRLWNTTENPLRSTTPVEIWTQMQASKVTVT
jgi:hypothetical protein